MINERPARMPVVFVPHRGGPWPFVDTGIGAKEELDSLAAYLRALAAVPKTLASAHAHRRRRGSDPGVLAYGGTILGLAISAFQFG